MLELFLSIVMRKEFYMPPQHTRREFKLGQELKFHVLELFLSRREPQLMLMVRRQEFYMFMMIRRQEYSMIRTSPELKYYLTPHQVLEMVETRLELRFYLTP